MFVRKLVFFMKTHRFRNLYSVGIHTFLYVSFGGPVSECSFLVDSYTLEKFIPDDNLPPCIQNQSDPEL